MFREIRTMEKITDLDEKKKELGYTKIKPEKELSMEELNSFWMEEFNKASMEMTS